MKQIILTVVCSIAVVSGSSAQEPQINVSKETTFVTEPTTENGFVDLISAINAKHSAGVTSGNNAAAVIYTELGLNPDAIWNQEPEIPQMADRFFAELGVPKPLASNDKFMSLSNYLLSQGFEANSEKFRHIQDQQGQAQQNYWSREEYPQVAGWLDRNKQHLDAIAQGVMREEYFCPINSTAEKGTTGQALIATLLPHIQSIREVARALNCRALMHAKIDENAEAWNDLLAAYRLGRHVRKGPFLIDALVGIAVEAITNHSALIFIEHSKPDDETAAKYLSDLAELPEQTAMAELVNFSERLMFVDIVAMLAYDKNRDVLGVEDGLLQLNGLIKKSRLDIDWNIILKNANQWYDQYVAAMQIDSYARQKEEIAKINAELSQLAQKFQQQSLLKTFAFALLDRETRSEYVGEMLVALLLPATGQAANAERRIEQRYENLRVAIALARYHSRNSQYPEDLNQLIPEQLHSLPEDLFAEAPLKYLKTETGYILYSIGINQVDDGGKSYDERKDDLVVKVPSS